MLCNKINDMKQNQYSTSELRRLRPAFNMLTLPSCTRGRLKSLGLKRRFRGHRGRNARKLRTVRWRADKVYNNGVHHCLLRSLPAEVKYDNNIQCKLGLVNTRSIRIRSASFYITPSRRIYTFASLQNPG